MLFESETIFWYVLFAANGNKTASNERFGAMAALPRRQFCGKLNVITPQQVQWKPRLRKAARAVIGNRRAAQWLNKV
jgi:hypothetical protein